MGGGAQPGEVIRGYRLDHLIAEGGMGAVWAATHTSLGRRAAVKLLAPALSSNQEYVSRFLSEARIVNDVRHPNIVDIFDFVQLESPPRVACIMELLDGPTLSQLIKRGPVPAPKALQVILQLVDALVQVHAAGVVHRDLKPQNIIVVADLEADLSQTCAVKILDFGIAKQAPALAAHKTATGSIMGTPAYMAPEQVAATEVSPATDLYALAEILFEMVCGQRLYRGDNLSILRQKMMSEAPTLALPQHLRDADRIQALLRPCLAPDPTARPGLSDFGTALAQLLEEWGESKTHDKTWPTLDSSTQDGLRTDPDPTQPAASAPASLPGGTSALRDITDDDEPVANTQMFYERILEDIDEASAKYVEPPVQASAPMDEPNLVLGTPQSGHAYGVEGPKHDPNTLKTDFRVAEERARALHMPIQVVQGQKTTSRKVPWVWIAVGLAVVLAAGALMMPSFRNQARAQMELLSADTPGVQEATAEWQKDFAPFTGSAKDLRAMGEKAHRLDTPAGYAQARELAKKALIVDPDDPEALALFLENEVLGFGDALLPSQRGTYLAWLAGLHDGEGATRRARALLTVEPELRRTLTQALLQSVAGRDRVVGAELVGEQDPRHALAALQRDDLPPRAVRVQARLRAAQGEYKAALAALAPRRNSEPNNPLLMAEAAQILTQAGELAQAEALWARASRLPPPNPRATLAHGRLAARLGKTAEAAQSLKDVAEAPTASPEQRAEAYTLWAHLALAQEAFPIADERAQQALKWRPDDPRALGVAVEARLQQGRPLAAEALLEPARTTHPKDPGLAALNATLLLSKNQPKPAQVWMETAAQAVPGDPRLAALCAVVATAAADPARQEVMVQHLLRLDPRFVDHEDEPTELLPSTLQVALEALRRDESPRAFALQGVLQYHLGDVRQAQKSLQQAPKEALAQLYLAQSWLDVGSAPRAMAVLGAAKDQTAPALSLVRARAEVVRHARVQAEADFAEARGAETLAGAAQIESEAARGDLEGLRAELAAHPRDPWLRAALYRLSE